MKKFKNVSSFEKAAEYLKENFFCPIWTEEGLSPEYQGDIDFAALLRDCQALLETAKNSAVRAAIHQVFIGKAWLWSFQEEDGCPYYDNQENYLGRGMIETISFIPECDKHLGVETAKFGTAVCAYRTPFDEDWVNHPLYEETLKSFK